MRLLTILTLLAGLSLGATTLSAQDSTRNVPDSLVSKAKITEDSARAVALKRVPGTVEKTTLMSRRGRLSWVFQIARAGRTSKSKVTVNANTGKVVSVARVSTKAKSTTRRSS